MICIKIKYPVSILRISHGQLLRTLKSEIIVYNSQDNYIKSGIGLRQNTVKLLISVFRILSFRHPCAAKNFRYFMNRFVFCFRISTATFQIII